MEIHFIDLTDGYVVIDNGYRVPISHMFDLDGDDCDAEDAVVCVFGPLPGDGEWITLDLDGFELEQAETIH